MRSRIVIPVVAVILLSALWYGFDFDPAFEHESGSEQWVARISGSEISLADYQVEYFKYITESGLPDEAKRRGDFLERLISMRLLAMDAERGGALETEAVRTELRRAETKLLIEGYLFRHVYNQIEVTEDDLVEMFARVNTRMSASHLYAPTLEAALELKERLQNGASFEVLAAEVFSSPELSQNGGSLGEFGFDEMDAEFESAAFSMSVGDISDPVKTRQGYSIIRLDAKYRSPLLTESEFAVRKAGLNRYVQVQKRNEAREALHEQILSSSEPVVNPILLRSLLEEIEGRAGEQTQLDVESPGGSDRSAQVLISSPAGDFTLGDFLDAAEMTSEMQRAAVVTLSTFEEFVTGLFVRRELLKTAAKADVMDSAAYATALRRQTNDLLYEAGWNELEAAIRVPDDSIEAHLNRFPDEFEVAETVRLREILLNDRNTATMVRSALNGSNFSALATEHSVRPGAARMGGDLGYVEREQLGVLAPQVFEAVTGQVLGPLEVGGRYAIFKIEDKTSRRAATVEESRDKIEAQLKSYWIRAIVRERTTELKQVNSIERQPALLASLEIDKTASVETP